MAPHLNEQVVKVLSAGLAGLEAIPYFIRELVEAEEPILPPLALDHDGDAIGRFRVAMGEGDVPKAKEMREFLHQHGYTFGPGDCVMPIAGWEDVRPEISIRNRVAYDLERLDEQDRVRMFDRPAALAVWADQHADIVWRNIRDQWKAFRAEYTMNWQLVILIPYCPEGPTSGTIGIQLGSALKSRITDARNRGDLRGLSVRIYGVEMCPPMPYEVLRNNSIERGNAFRGYVARLELLNKLEGQKLEPYPFDSSFVVDAGREHLDSTLDRTELFQHLDRAAASVGAAVVRGAIGKDRGESETMLHASTRWKVVPLKVQADTSGITVLRYLKKFPAFTDELENAGDNEDQLTNHMLACQHLNTAYKQAADSDAFSRLRIAESQVDALAGQSEAWRTAYLQLQDTKSRRNRNRILAFFLAFIPRLRRPSDIELKAATDHLSETATAAHDLVGQMKALFETFGAPSAPWRPEVMGVTVRLTSEQMESYDDNEVSQETKALTDLLGVFDYSALQDVLSTRVTSYLSRYTWNSESGSRTLPGVYSGMVVTFIGRLENDRILPNPNRLAMHIQTAGSNSDHEAAVFVQQPNPNVQDWSISRSQIEHDLGCNIFVFAADADVADVCSYQDMLRVDHEVRSDSKMLLSYARYFVRATAEFLEDYRIRGANGGIPAEEPSSI